MRTEAARVGIVGGGRWARVLAEEIDCYLPAGSSLTLCSVSNPSSWEQWAQRRRSRPVSLVSSWGKFLESDSISHVLIARKAADHAQTVIECLAAGKEVFVEKPFCTTRYECRQLLDAVGNKSCTVGYVLLYAPGIRKFAAECVRRGSIRRITILWTDPVAEVRYGQQKKHDQTLSVMQDVFPHAWSIVRLFDPVTDLRMINGTSLDRRGEVAFLSLEAGRCKVNVFCARGQQARARQIFVDADTFTAHLDFAEEPGRVSLNGVPASNAIGQHGALRAEIAAFLAGPGSSGYNPRSEILNSAETVLIPLDALSHLSSRAPSLSEFLHAGDPCSAELICALRRYITTASGLL
jgi:predicted dehydrogenase